uniref:Uncharacterized protein n=1 Tax=Globodera rostochiensis TaxID=31243 RepID=A0A914HWY5_GLORO
MLPNLLLLLLAVFTSVLHQPMASLSSDADSSNPIRRLMQRRHLVPGRGIHKEQWHSNVHPGYLQWEKDKFHEALGEKILPKSSRNLMDPKFLGSLEPRLLKSSTDGVRTTSDSEETKWRNWLRRYFLADKTV